MVEYFVLFTGGFDWKKGQFPTYPGCQPSLDGTLNRRECQGARDDYANADERNIPSAKMLSRDGHEAGAADGGNGSGGLDHRLCCRSLPLKWPRI